VNLIHDVFCSPVALFVLDIFQSHTRPCQRDFLIAFFSIPSSFQDASAPRALFFSGSCFPAPFQKNKNQMVGCTVSSPCIFLFLFCFCSRYVSFTSGLPFGSSFSPNAGAHDRDRLLVSPFFILTLSLICVPRDTGPFAFLQMTSTFVLFGDLPFRFSPG